MNSTSPPTDIATFINCLNELPEFTDEPINQSMRSFQDDLKLNSAHRPTVQRYIHDLTTEIGNHLDSITETLSMFIETGVPTIRFQQQHSLSNLLNLSTVATIFSAVTAIMLQLSCKSTGHTLADLVNTFRFSSLVFSMAAAVNSFLGLTWKQAI
ncbi:hypothetical protein JVT61DRAFT_5111 [Boletus reticuloceps]|uniref:Uncharacterized protein n=1 Tax=Boletus reticuloceps TaxID=495285 RepID=A0A8I3ACU2_9AGAM|nr:hypothetical protein JVT61DRAFT_5111 [Boletus reticuloceps]